MSANEQKNFVIDTCSLTELKRKYPPDIFNSVWRHIDSLILDKILLSIEDVFIELQATDDELLDWAKMKKREGFFIEIDHETQINTRKVLSSHPNLLDIKKRKSSADAFLIAFAMYNNSVVVTQEKKSGGPERSKIPDVCDAYGIPCIDLLRLLRQTGFNGKFELSSNNSSPYIEDPEQNVAEKYSNN